MINKKIKSKILKIKCKITPFNIFSKIKLTKKLVLKFSLHKCVSKHAFKKVLLKKGSLSRIIVKI